MPIIELPFRSVGPEPAMITAIGTRPLASRGTTSVPGSSKAPLLIVYGDSTATAGGTVSAVCTANAMRARLRTIMLFPLPEDVRLHDRNHHHDEDRGDEQRKKRALRQKDGSRDDEAAEDHQPPAGAMCLSPDGVTERRPGRANTDEPVGLDAREEVAEDDQEQAHADRHEPVDLHGIAETGGDDHPMPDQNEEDDRIRDQPIRPDELGVVRMSWVEP